MILDKEELLNTNGGSAKAIGVGIALFVGGVLTVIVGIIDGYLRPLSCNK